MGSTLQHWSSIDDSCQSDTPPAHSCRRWVILAAFGYNAAFNAVASMNFSSQSKLSETLLNTDEAGVDWLYSGLLLAVLPSVFPAAYGLVRANYSTSVVGVALNVLGGWLRLVAVPSSEDETGSFPLALLSSCALGISAGIIICSYTR